MEKQKMINMYKVLGLKLIAQGIKFLQMAFHLKPKTTSQTFIKTLLTGIQMPLCNVCFADTIYNYVDLETMKDIILYDWTDQKEYLKEIYDCDDFALTFKSHMAERYHINSIAVGKHIQISDIDTGAHIGYHRANIFLASDNDVIKIYFLESQTDKVVEVKDYNELINLTGWLNKLNIFDF